jgi:outer membrane protein assembly factor BamB
MEASGQLRHCLMFDGTLFFGSEDGRVYSVDADSG